MKEKEVATKIHNAGGTMYLVGGALRDEIMGLKPHDKDYCVTGLSFDEFQNLFKEAKNVGTDFSVFLFDGAEISLARKERKISRGYKGFEIYNSKNITIEEDLKRRDITINAIAKNVLTGQIIDPYNGIEDIKTKRIRHVSKSFAEDPLRVYRVARFAAKFRFKVDKETLLLMNSLKDELQTLSVERIAIELKKALESDEPSIFFNTLKSAKVLDVHFKEIYDLIGVPQPLKYHPEGDVYNHTMIVLDNVSKRTKDTAVRFAALVHDLGKALTPKEILPQHIGHDKVGIELVIGLCERLKLPNKWKKMGVESAKYHMKAGICTNMKPFKQAVFFNILKKSAIGIDNMKIITDEDDMLKRPVLDYAMIAKKVLSEIDGNYMIKNGYLPDKMGVENFKTLMYEKQAEKIKKMEEELWKIKEN